MYIIFLYIDGLGLLIFVEDFYICIHRKYQSLVSFLVLSLLGFGFRVVIKLVWEVFLPFQFFFLKEFIKDCISSSFGRIYQWSPLDLRFSLCEDFNLQYLYLLQVYSYFLFLFESVSEICIFLFLLSYLICCHLIFV